MKWRMQFMLAGLNNLVKGIVMINQVQDHQFYQNRELLEIEKNVRRSSRVSSPENSGQEI